MNEDRGMERSSLTIDKQLGVFSMVDETQP